MTKNIDEDGDVECPTCGNGMKFKKRKASTKEWPNEDGYSEWYCTNKKCEDYDEDQERGDIHRLYDNGDCETR